MIHAISKHDGVPKVFLSFSDSKLVLYYTFVVKTTPTESAIREVRVRIVELIQTYCVAKRAEECFPRSKTPPPEPPAPLVAAPPDAGPDPAACSEWYWSLPQDVAVGSW